MRVSFPSAVEDINDTDFDILRCLYENGPLWKMEITRRINERRSDGELLLDLQESISKQAVARRVERLHELDYVESTIIAAGEKPGVDVSREFMVAYRVGDKGREKLEEAVRLVLGKAVSDAITGGTKIQGFPGLDRHLSLYFSLNGHEGTDIFDFLEKELA